MNTGDLTNERIKATGVEMVYTVSQMNGIIKKQIESTPDFKKVYIKGEISNLTAHSSGHYYFSLKDSGSVLKCIMFRSSASKLVFAPENGLNIICRGRISVYASGGYYQLTVDAMKPDGVGELYIAFEQLKKKLGAEGLFDTKLKRALPKTPYRIGIVTSPTGAAVRDIITISRRRFPPVKMFLYPALVQGDGAAASIIRGIEYFNNTDLVDVIIVGRGGGSIEDLWAFNDESLARTIFHSNIPTVSAVGHETDFTISDFVADVRAATPSDAAQICLPEIDTCKTRLGNVSRRLSDSQMTNISKRRNELVLLQNSKAMTSPQNTINDRRIRLIELENNIISNIDYIVKERKTEVRHISEKLTLLDPFAPLGRGYAVVFDKDKPITRASQLKSGEMVKLKFADGIADTKVFNVETEDLGDGGVERKDERE